MRTEPSQLNVHYHVIASEADFSIDASFINYVLIDVVHTKKKRRECQCIGGSKGGVPGARPPLWDPILSFSHTFSPKSAHVGGPRPPLREILDPPLQCFDKSHC